MSKKVVAWAVATLGGLGGLALLVGRERHKSGGSTLPALLDAVEMAVFENGLMRIAMNKTALDKETMERLYNLAIKAKLPKLAATIHSIATDGKPSGPNYVPTPTDELWPGSTKSVAQYLNDQLKLLAEQSSKAQA